MVALDVEVTGQLERGTIIERVRTVLPFTPVVLPWIVARLLVVPVMILRSPHGGGTYPPWLLAMDGGWFRAIAVDWYDQHDGVGGISEYPFFPLFPAAGGVLMRLGMPSTVALAGLSWAAALIAMAGARLLAIRHVGEQAGRLAPWVIALAPGGLSLILGYSDAFFLAGMVWAFVALDHRRWWLAGVLAAVATASRPNGAIAVIGLLVVAFVLRAGWRQLVALVLPSAAFLVGWMVYLEATTGDAVLFWTAKAGWIEMTMLEFLADPLKQRLAFTHIALLIVFLIPYAMRFRRQPPAWAVIALLGVMPALALGVVGVARYAVLAFPLPIAFADVLSGRPRWIIAVTLSVSAAALMIFARLVVTKSWVP